MSNVTKARQLEVSKRPTINGSLSQDGSTNTQKPRPLGTTSNKQVLSASKINTVRNTNGRVLSKKGTGSIENKAVSTKSPSNGMVKVNGVLSKPNIEKKPAIKPTTTDKSRLKPTNRLNNESVVKKKLVSSLQPKNTPSSASKKTNDIPFSDRVKKSSRTFTKNELEVVMKLKKNEDNQATKLKVNESKQADVIQPNSIQPEIINDDYSDDFESSYESDFEEYDEEDTTFDNDSQNLTKENYSSSDSDVTSELKECLTNGRDIEEPVKKPKSNTILSKSSFFSSNIIKKPLQKVNDEQNLTKLIKNDATKLVTNNNLQLNSFSKGNAKQSKLNVSDLKIQSVIKTSNENVFLKQEKESAILLTQESTSLSNWKRQKQVAIQTKDRWNRQTQTDLVLNNHDQESQVGLLLREDHLHLSLSQLKDLYNFLQIAEQLLHCILSKFDHDDKTCKLDLSLSDNSQGLQIEAFLFKQLSPDFDCPVKQMICISGYLITVHEIYSITLLCLWPDDGSMQTPYKVLYTRGKVTTILKDIPRFLVCGMNSGHLELFDLHDSVENCVFFDQDSQVTQVLKKLNIDKKLCKSCDLSTLFSVSCSEKVIQIEHISKFDHNQRDYLIISVSENGRIITWKVKYENKLDEQEELPVECCNPLTSFRIEKIDELDLVNLIRNSDINMVSLINLNLTNLLSAFHVPPSMISTYLLGFSSGFLFKFTRFELKSKFFQYDTHFSCAAYVNHIQVNPKAENLFICSFSDGTYYLFHIDQSCPLFTGSTTKLNFIRWCPKIFSKYLIVTCNNSCFLVYDLLLNNHTKATKCLLQKNLEIVCSSLNVYNHTLKMFIASKDNCIYRLEFDKMTANMADFDKVLEKKFLLSTN